MQKAHKSLPGMQVLFSRRERLPIITFLKEHGFQFEANADLNALVDATCHYFELFSKDSTGYLFTEHLYPLPQYLLLRANMEHTENHWVHSQATPEIAIGRYSLPPHSGKISACFWDHLTEFEDDKFGSVAKTFKIEKRVYSGRA